MAAIIHDDVEWPRLLQQRVEIEVEALIAHVNEDVGMLGMRARLAPLLDADAIDLHDEQLHTRLGEEIRVEPKWNRNARPIWHAASESDLQDVKRLARCPELMQVSGVEGTVIMGCYSIRFYGQCGKDLIHCWQCPLHKNQRFIDLTRSNLNFISNDKRK